MQHSNRELWLAFFAILFITTGYLAVMVLLGNVPAASGLIGHSLGVLGFMLMLATETLYSLRKRSRNARWGRMSLWLEFHIFTGIVGPYMVLLHSAWKFNGLAGIVLLLTVIIVLSGFIGRYIYTTVPRTADGVEMEASLLEGQIAATEAEIHKWLQASPQVSSAVSTYAVATSSTPMNPLALILERPVLTWQENRQWRAARRHLHPSLRKQMDQISKMIRRRNALRRQMASLAMARQMMALWHMVHIPIGLALFSTAFIHSCAAFYYATLLR